MTAISTHELSTTPRHRRIWVARTPTPLPEREPDPKKDRIGRAVFWPLAIMLFVHRVLVLAPNGAITDDFTTVYTALRRFHDGTNVYGENYTFIDPHYLYSPGATLVLSPLGLIQHFGLARVGFIGINALAIVLALGLLTMLFRFRLTSWVWPFSITAAFLSEAVRSTLVFSNINGILLFVYVIFLFALIEKKNWLAGSAIGLGILIKPIFLPLLFLPFIRNQWQTWVAGLLIPVIFNAIAWPLVPGANDYVTRTIPYLKITRDFANSSIPGMALYFGMPKWQQSLWFYGFAAALLLAVILLARFRHSDPLLWAVTTASLLLTGVFLLSNLGQMYYSMLLFPLLFTVSLVRSAMHTAVAWFGVYFMFTPDSWITDRVITLPRWVLNISATIGWSLLIIAITAAALVWVIKDLRSHPTSSFDTADPAPAPDGDAIPAGRRKPTFPSIPPTADVPVQPGLPEES